MVDMVMEAQDRAIVVFADDVGCSNKEASTIIVKGKRTKRQRQPSPLPFPPPPLTTISNDAGDCNYVSSTATSSQSSAESTCTEEEDMANCLILLAQGRRSISPPPPATELKPFIQSDKPPPPPAADQRGVFVYQCKTCDRCFNSFQALGGHRASHKKPRIAGGGGEAGEEIMNNNKINTKVVIKSVNQKLREEGGAELALSLRIVNTAAVVNDNGNHPLPAPAPVKPSKVHECAICGAGFSSGQALGGHMRRHRTVVPPSPVAALTAVRNGLELDLNLPAPEDGDGNNKFRFPAKGVQQLVFSAASPMVDCHF